MIDVAVTTCSDSPCRSRFIIILYFVHRVNVRFVLILLCLLFTLFNICVMSRAARNEMVLC